jgi:hypothetical protein
VRIIRHPVFMCRRALCVRSTHPLARVVMRLPMWVPVGIYAVRVGADTTHVAIGFNPTNPFSRS